MELAGEITSGYFFEDIPGPQFIAKDAVALLSGPLPEDEIYWFSTTDPAYPYEILKNHYTSSSKTTSGAQRMLSNALPYRHKSSHVVFHGPTPVLISRKRGKEIEIRVDPGDPLLPSYLKFFHSLTNRKVEPLTTVKIETINGLPIPESPYADIFTAAGFQKDYNRLVLRGGY
jgi:ATP-dependent helicase Lhr and Lhr-like helicase